MELKKKRDADTRTKSKIFKEYTKPKIKVQINLWGVFLTTKKKKIQNKTGHWKSFPFTCSRCQTHLHRVQVAFSSLQYWMITHRSPLVQRLSQVCDVIGGQDQNVQLGELRVRRHGWQGGLKALECLAQISHSAPLPRCIFRGILCLWWSALYSRPRSWLNN